MKNFIFKSSNDPDLQKLFQLLDIIQKEQRHARYDLQLGLKHLDTIVKAVAILVAVPEEDPEDPSIGLDQDNRDGD